MLRYIASSRKAALQRVCRAQLLSTKSIPDEAQVVVIGGGIIGNSVAYHLGKLGMKNVVLCEQSKVTSGTTWHAAGLMVTFGSLSETSTELRKYSKNLYNTVLEEETGQSTGFKGVGFIELAADADRLEEYRRVSAFNRKCGVDVQEIGPNDVKQLFPLCKTDDILAGFYVKDDGRVNPVDVTMALSKGARLHGVTILEDTRVSQIQTGYMSNHATKKVTGVTLENGHTIKTQYVVNCAGMWARQLGAQNGLIIPNQAAEHYYLVTDRMPEVDPNWPVVEDPSNYTYIRPEAGGLMVGLFEGKAAPWNVKRIPNEFSFGEIEPDWERMGPYVEAAMSRVPATITAGVKKFFCGPESFTPDLAPIVGEVPEIRNYFVAAGLNSIGILTGGGIGRLVANWIITGKPDMDVTGINADRFHPYQCNPEYRQHRVAESLGLVYKTHYPYKSKESARGAKRSPFYDRLVKQNAYFKDVSGWEGADWFAPKGVAPIIEKHSWQRYPFFPYWQREHQACREGVIVMDMSFMSKFMIQGKDAGEALNYISTANVNAASNMITYCQWLNEDGKMEADLTVTKLAEDKFYVIATDTAHRHVETHMKKHLNPEGNKFVTVTDVTGGYAQLNVQGPKSRELMQLLTDCDMSNEAFPFRTAKEVDIGFAKVMCARITYLGELGYELHIPSEHALHVYERIVENGDKVGLVHAGLKALASLRMEKAYRDYGHDMDNTDTLLEVSLNRFFSCPFQILNLFV
jgi:glycine cleavage system aminomethyltransferase T/glycine/D-amino acid oxidase-like deaminating enzyme